MTEGAGAYLKVIWTTLRCLILLKNDTFWTLSFTRLRTDHRLESLRPGT
jgi:hypothetical protein